MESQQEFYATWKKMDGEPSGSFRRCFCSGWRRVVDGVCSVSTASFTIATSREGCGAAIRRLWYFTSDWLSPPRQNKTQAERAEKVEADALEYALQQMQQEQHDKTEEVR